ncbi:hypothetical protein K2Z83_14365 [Oscillochloris sp. ZM17-4]|uniref:hypothetical protein n=1 Tax=Oscillochloris sp. ZM17-4 TaxID=2866714 RepID=UPI001C739DB5|nr:hypothetical protein [Oscillochloris sp. ZM17-4]MBX0328860.1 hypothetical protein [Oscillochloris sp. ZM17-4]
MGRTVKHVELHRIGTTELRVVSDIDTGEMAIVQAEEAVIRDYMRHGGWPHQQVSLFIFSDLAPVARQVPASALPPGGADALAKRTVINLYDLANPGACNVFVNQQMMIKEGYWGDALAVRGLLAHEHAHPLAENGSTRASRGLALALTLDAQPDVQRGRLEGLLSRLAEELCLTAPREIFTNLLAITSGFAEAMLHLNQRNVANAVQSVAGRARLCELLSQEVAQGSRSASSVGQILLVGDLESYCGLAMELAPFDRSGHTAAAATLADALERDLFPQLAPQFAPTFAAIRRLYAELPAELSPAELRGWSQQVADVIVAAVRAQGLAAHCVITEPLSR